MSIETALIIAPHPDDEINLAGQMIVNLRKKIQRYMYFIQLMEMPNIKYKTSGLVKQ